MVLGTYTAVDYSDFNITLDPSAEVDPCACPGAGLNWAIVLNDTCHINDCNLSNGNITFSGVGNVTINGTLIVTHIGQLPANQTGYIKTSKSVYVG